MCLHVSILSTQATDAQENLIFLIFTDVHIQE